MSASADCSCRARKGLRALPPASVVMCKVTEAACRGVGGRRADGGRKQGGQSAAFYRRVPRPRGRAAGPSGRRRGPRVGGGGGAGPRGAASRVVRARHFTGGCRAPVFGPSGHRAVGGRRRCPSKGRRGQERDGYG